MSKKLIGQVMTGLGCAAASFVAIADSDSPLAQGRFAMAGYGDVSYISADGGNDAFASRFIPIFLYQVNDKIHIESELEFGIGEDGETETELEYADLHYYLTDSTVITAGKFLLPFGQFGPNLHPSWINRLPSMPGIYGGHGGNGTMTPLLPLLSDVGVSASQTINLGGESRLFIDAYMVNGPKDDFEDGELHGAEFEPSNSDNNDSKALGGRIAYAWLPRLEVGASFYQGAYDPGGNLDFMATGIDFNYIAGFYTVRGEYIKTEMDKQEVPADPVTQEDRNGWYLQGSWQARQLNIDSLNPVELVLRRSEINKIDGGERWTVGANYWLSPSTALKLAFEDTSLDSGEDDNRIFTQLAFGF